MGEKANFIEAPAASPDLLDTVGGATMGVASSLSGAAAAGVTGGVTAEVSNAVRDRRDDKQSKAPGVESAEPDAEGGAK